MLCCLGLVAGFAAGATLGPPWAFIAPIAGFGLGSIGDIMLSRSSLHGIHKSVEQWVRTRQGKLRHEESTEV